MKKALILSVLMLAGCDGGVVVGETPCGLIIRGPAPDYFLAKAIKLETQAMKIFALPEVQAMDPRFAHACERIRNWSVYVHVAESFVSDGRTVFGVTDCNWFSLEVAERGENVYSSLTHELAHVIQRCNPITDPADPKNDEHHQNWDVLFNAFQRYIL